MSSISIYIKKSLAAPLRHCVNNYKIFNKYKPHDEYLVVMYHRITIKNESKYFMQDGMYVDPDTFRMQILHLMDNYNIVPLEKILSIRDTNNKFENNKPCCIITFDDGWKDFYENAYPILKCFQVYSTVFLPTDYIGTNKLFWTDKLAWIFKCKECKNDKYDIIGLTSSLGDAIKQIESIHLAHDLKIEKMIQILKKLPTKEIDDILDELAYKWHVNINTQGPSFLSWDEVKEMHDSGVVYFGSHTKSHQILTTSSDEVIQKELVQSKNMLIENNVVSPSFVPFAYPNGNYTRKIANMVRDAGYSIAVTTERGWNRLEGDRNDLYKLKRVGIHQDIASSESMFACRIMGIY